MGIHRYFLVMIIFIVFPIKAAGEVEFDRDSPISFKVEMLPWNEVNEILPKYSNFTVIDVETRKHFNVQRRAGTYHADVQPLTSQDTKMMKSIFNGQWTWKRRAILILSEDRLIAASMHGMPHGAGALKNNFPGHFCIHFFGSITHRSNKMDLSHLLMILKAAGKLDEYLTTISPSDTVHAYIASLHQQDEHLFNYISLQPLKSDIKEHILKIEAIKVNRINIDLNNSPLRGGVYVPVELSLYIKNEGLKRIETNILLVRTSPMEGWKVDSEYFVNENFPK